MHRLLELKRYLAHGFKVFLIEALAHLSLTRLVYRNLQSNCTLHKRWEARQNPNLVGETRKCMHNCFSDPRFLLI